jgi:mobilization protein NikA
VPSPIFFGSRVWAALGAGSARAAIRRPLRRRKKKKLRLSSFAAFGLKCRIACRLLFATTSLTMSDGAHLTTWVNRETKTRFAAVARHQGLSDSALLKRLIDTMLQAGNAASAVATDGRAGRVSRLSIRLRPDDQILLRERAAARGMPAATYVSVLTRAHLRSLSPLPREELLALRRTVSELGSIGRNLNQIARAANQGERVSGPSREDLRAILRVCEGLRDHVKTLLSANIKSWEQGYAEPGV